VTFDLLHMDDAVSGSIVLTFSVAQCLTATLEDYRLVDAGNDVTLNGPLELCEEEAWASGPLDVAALTTAAGDFRFEMLLDGTELATVEVFDLATGLVLGSCTVDLDTSATACIEV
jgi:hypothetical protein